MKRILGYVITILLILAVIYLILDSWRSLGDAPAGEYRSAIERSEQWQDGKFRNDLPLTNYLWRSVKDGFGGRGSGASPNNPLPVHPNDGSVYKSTAQSGLRVTWLGHSSVVLEIDESTFLLDPVWGQRASPFTHFGPKRWYESPLALEQLPVIDAVVISHDHYDHLDRYTIERLSDKVKRFIVPLGVGAHLEYWGVAHSKIVELDWWQSVEVRDVEVVLTPARHASGRHLLDLDRTLWGGFAFLGQHRVFYSGDTGLFPGFKEIGERLGPFDLTMIEVGAYNRNWPDWHLGPEQAVIANQWVKGKQLLPLHWGLFILAPHNWTEPMERTLAAAELSNLSVITPRPGQPIEPSETETGRWWPDLAWQSASEHAVLSTKLSDMSDAELSLIRGE